MDFGLLFDSKFDPFAETGGRGVGFFMGIINAQRIYKQTLQKEKREMRMEELDYEKQTR